MSALTFALMIAVAATATVAVGATRSVTPKRVPFETDVPIETFSTGWIVGAKAAGATPFNMKVLVRQSNREVLEASLLAAADPTSEAYVSVL